MPQYYPVVVQAGRNLAGDSLGFHAYSLRVDNCTNQWYLEETSLAYIPPYSLGICLRLYGTGVAILLNSAPIGQPQLAPITGEQVVGTYSDQLRTEVAPSPIRQFTLVQSVSDLTQGAMPATPPVGVTRMWAASDGTLHYLLPTGVDATLISTSNYQSYVQGVALGGDLYGTVNNGHVGVLFGDALSMYDSGGTLRPFALMSGPNLLMRAPGTGPYYWQNQAASSNLASLDQSGNYNASGNLSATGNLNISGYASIGPGTPNQAGDIGVARVSAPTTGVIYLGNSAGRYLFYDGTQYNLVGASLSVGGWVIVPYASGGMQFGAVQNHLWVNTDNNVYWDNYAAAWNFRDSSAGYPIRLSVGQTIFQVNTTAQFAGSIGAQGVGAGYCFTAPNAAAAYGQGYANAWINASSRDFKENLAPIDNPLGILLNPALRGVQYDHNWHLPATEARGELGGTKHNIGFVADDWLPWVPEIVAVDENGKPEGMDYARVTALLWEALREFVTSTSGRLEALEARAV